MKQQIYRYINLAKRIDRKKSFETNVSSLLKYDIKLVEAIDMTNKQTPGERAAGCSLSHLSIWKEIIDSDIPFAVIFEDDLQLTSEVKQIEQIIDAVCNSDIYVCNLAYNPQGQIHWIDNTFGRCANIQTTSCYIISKQAALDMYDTIVKATENLLNLEPYNMNAIDIVWKQFQTNPQWLVVKSIGIQQESHSDIMNKQVDYRV